MRKPSRVRRLLKWALTGLTVLVLWGVAFAPWSEAYLGKAVSIRMADGVLTVRTWGTAGGVSQGIPSDDPEQHPRGIPDTRNVPVWILVLVLVAPTALLWWADRRSTTLTARHQRDQRGDRPDRRPTPRRLGDRPRGLGW